MRKILNSLTILILVMLPTIAIASDGGGHEDNIVHKMMVLAFQIGIIIFAAKLGGIIFDKLKMPTVLGELFSGIIIGPYLLGKVAIPGFSHGVFAGFLHTNPDAVMPISPELYGLATLASILLLFMAGLETDLKMFLKFSLAGSLVGIGGVAGSFIVGAATAMFFMDIPFMDPKALFLGVMSTATSVGITARILSERRKMASPEGVTIIAGAVIDDVLGIIILAIVLGIVAAGGAAGGEIAWGHIALIAAKAIGVWLGFTALGLIFADKIASFLKKFNGTTSISILSLGLALIMAGVFEQAGLAMIIGAYVMGLSLSKTDLAYAIQHSLHPVQELLVPIFFVVSGMMVNPFALTTKSALIFGTVYTVGAIVSKIVGCAIPSYFLKFNNIGALRIGLGMVPRGEVALIIASIGLSNGILTGEMFGVAIMMTLITTLFAPPALNAALKVDKQGMNKAVEESDSVELNYDFPTGESVTFVMAKIVTYFKGEGFFINEIDEDGIKYFVRRDDIFLIIVPKEKGILIELAQNDVSYIETLVYESLIDLSSTIEKLQEMSKPKVVHMDTGSHQSVSKVDLSNFILRSNIILKLRAETKEEVIEELIERLDDNGYINDKEEVLSVVKGREESMSTGMQYGLAIPHGKCTGINELCISIGIKKDGLNFDALDGEPSTVFVLILSSADDGNPHIQVLAGIGTKLSTPEKMKELLACKSTEDVKKFFID